MKNDDQIANDAPEIPARDGQGLAPMPGSGFEAAEQLRNATEIAASWLARLEMRNAHMEGRIRFYLAVLNGEWKRPVNLAECIAEDLRRIKSGRAEIPNR